MNLSSQFDWSTLLPMLPLLAVALLIWAGVFAFTLYVDRKIAVIEKRLEAQQAEREEQDER